MPNSASVKPQRLPLPNINATFMTAAMDGLAIDPS
jgi:hypothetical protein